MLPTNLVLPDFKCIVDRPRMATGMLVLTRKLGQSIKIGDDVEVVVLEVRGEQVRIGIRAPKTVSVHRKEVYDQIHPDELGDPPKG